MLKRNSLGELRDTMRTVVPNDHLHETARRRVIRRYPRAPLHQPPADAAGAVSGKSPAKQNGQQELQMDPRPDEIARFRFSRRFFGAHPGEVQRALLEVAATLDRSQVALARETLERRTLEKSLEAASTTVRALQQQLMAARTELSACHDRERALARELVVATAEQSRSRQVTESQPDEIVRVAGQAADLLMANARAAALEVLLSARAAAQAITRSMDVVIVINRPPAAGTPEPSNREPITPQGTARVARRYRLGTLQTIV